MDSPYADLRDDLPGEFDALRFREALVEEGCPQRILVTREQRDQIAEFFPGMEAMQRDGVEIYRTPYTDVLSEPDATAEQREGGSHP